jgi:hypothetical protein
VDDEGKRFFTPVKLKKILADSNPPLLREGRFLGGAM